MWSRTRAAFSIAVAGLALAASAGAVAPKPVAGRCAYALGLILRPPGLVDVYMYRVNGPLQLQQSTRLATVSRVGGTLSAACTHVKALAPARTRGLAGPWPLRVESKVYCPEGGTLQGITPFPELRKPAEPTADPRPALADEIDPALGGRERFEALATSYCDRSSIH